MLRAALGQFTGSYRTEANVEKAYDMALTAAGAGANLICYPELANTVYMPWENDPRHFAKAEPEDGPSVTRMREAARQTEMMIVYPFFERTAAGEYFNSAVVIDRAGAVVGKYRKTSIPSSRLFEGGVETYYFKPGDLPFRVWDTPWGVKFGLIICYDRNLPEPARCLGLLGADLMLVPVATVAKVRPWWEVLLRAEAIHNVMYVGACNKVGPDVDGAPDTHYFGSSLFIDPRGEIVAQASDQEEEILYADIDPEVIREQRRHWKFYEDRRPDLYGALVQPSPAPAAREPASR